LASDVAFGVVFGLFLAALLVLAFIAVRWGVRRDRPGREAWKRRHLEGELPEALGPRGGEGPESGRPIER
jgi:hypothetical protein